MNGYNFMDALNGTGSFAGGTADEGGPPHAVPVPQARNIRLALRFTF
jgi:hypothetical protein